MNEIIALKNADSKQLLERYKKLFGEDASSNHRLYLWRKVAYKLQEHEYGSMSAKAKNRLKALVEEFDPINNKALRPANPAVSQQPSIKDKRLPIPGTVITKEYKNAKYQVKVLEKGFEYNGKIFKTLSAIAKEITGSHWNGFLFFNL
ncbi:MAG: DUF2924 domain-containing protein [Candidatus Omnitrophica bacterium]|nr:DUF2924 domain-containing protein [Candidatus Omnitrophota bacterium]